MAYSTPNSAWVGAWIERMAWRWGGVVRDRQAKDHDWGQALCIEVYGPFTGDNWPDDPTEEDIARAKSWEDGDWPDWVLLTWGCPHGGGSYQALLKKEAQDD